MSEETKVLYNGECPVCAFEINHYAAYSKDNALPLRFDDLNVAELGEWGLTQDQAARRLYVLKDNELTSGIPAFLILWQDMPRYRWLAKLVGLPGLKQIAGFGYDWILAPVIYRWHLRRQARKQNVEHS